ncbi:Cytochrome c oxidase subunit [Dirofilaria immitis]|nr:hypothetical protein [Dirofilaria immitis]
MCLMLIFLLFNLAYAFPPNLLENNMTHTSNQDVRSVKGIMQNDSDRPGFIHEIWDKIYQRIVNDSNTSDIKFENPLLPHLFPDIFNHSNPSNIAINRFNDSNPLDIAHQVNSLNEELIAASINSTKEKF